MSMNESNRPFKSLISFPQQPQLMAPLVSQSQFSPHPFSLSRFGISEDHVVAAAR